MTLEIRILPRAEGSFAEWRAQARGLLIDGVDPDDVSWIDGDGPADLLAGSRPERPRRPLASPHVPRAFLEIAERVACHRDPHRWDRLYRALFRVAHGERALLEDPLDPIASALAAMDAAVRKDEHHAHAFVRFRKVAGGWIAWHRPEHRIVPRLADFFAKRFSDARWSLLTPDASVHHEVGGALAFGPGVPRREGMGTDELEELWRAYWSAISDPARTNLRAMTQEMPKKHWSTLPETRALRSAIAEAPRRVLQMQERAAAMPRVELPVVRDLAALRDASRACTGCELHGPATQTVFGEGPPDARLVLVGEQPGDEEDRRGRAFVGPAGGVLDDALREAGIDRASIYVTNAVKHFRFEPRGKVRLHQRPRARDVQACRPWLEAELAAIRPSTIVLLGATAATSVMGSTFRLSAERGRVHAHPWAERVIATWHPAAILRAEPESSAIMLRELIEDLALAR